MDKAVCLVYWFILLFAPLALGMTDVWGKAVVEGLCFALLVVWLIRCRKGKRDLYSAPGIRPLLLLVLLPLVQLIPLPSLLLRLLSPASAQIYSETVWVARPDLWMPISLAPKATLGEFFRFASYGAFYLATIQQHDCRERLKETASVVAAFAALFAVCGVFLFVASGGRILWYLGDWSGSFAAAGANQDHFAGLAAMVLPLILGYFLAIRPQITYLSLQETARDFLRHPRSHPHLVLATCVLLLIVALLLSTSVIGLISSLGSILVFLVLLLVRGSRHKKRLWSALAVVVLVFSVVFFSWGLVWTSKSEHAMESGRIAWESETVWLDTLNLFGDFPVMGAGVGSFANVYPRYRTERTTDAAIHHAGNDYLEQLAEAGIVGAVLLVWFLLSLLWRTVPVWRHRHNRLAVYLFLGSLAGLFAALLHGLGDFVRSIGAFGLYGFFLAGMVVAAAHTRSRGEGFKDLMPKNGGSRGLPLLTVVMLLTVNLLFNIGVVGGSFMHKALVAEESRVSASGASRERIADLASRAALFDPLEANYRYLQGDLSLAEGDVGGALTHFGEAMRRDPMDPEYLQRTAFVLKNLGRGGEAEQLLRAGVANDPTSAERHMNLAFWLLEEERRREGLEQVREAIQWDPDRTGDFIALMSFYGLEDEEMRSVLPQRSVPLLIYGDYLASLGKDVEAEMSYSEAVEAAIREKRPSPTPFRRVSEYHMQNGNFSDALEVVQAGIERFPEEAEFRMMAAMLYEQLAISYRAVEEYRRVLILDPQNTEARRRLKRLSGDLR